MFASLVISTCAIWCLATCKVSCYRYDVWPYLHVYVRCFQKSILSSIIIKSQLQPQTSQKRRLSHHLACLSICSCCRGCLTLHRLFSALWTAPLTVYKGCLHTCTTPVWALRTYKHTFSIWKLFSMPQPPMALPSTLKNEFLQSPLWKFSATPFRRKDQPPRPITPPR